MSNRYTFLDIYKNDLDLNKDTKVKISQIVIPKIQRPYAQGRQDGVCTYVRNTLLNEMFSKQMRFLISTSYMELFVLLMKPMSWNYWTGSNV